MIVLADRKAVYQLLDKKGSIYSDRPYLEVPTFMSRGCHMTFEQATPGWREKRSVVTRNLNPKNLDEKHFRVQEAESTVFMNNLLHHPNQSFDYARLYASSVASILSWGFRAKDFESFFYKDFYEFVDQASHLCPPPFLKLTTDISGWGRSNPVQIRRSNRRHGCGICRELGRTERTMCVGSWIRRGPKRDKWLKRDGREATFATR